MADMNKQVAPGNGRDNAKIVQTAAELELLLDELGEIESFEPPPEFRARARITDPEVYAAAARDPEGYWAGRARKLHWDTPFSSVLDESKAPFVTWFADGTLNVSYNCLDRHVEAGLGDRIAYHWRGEEGEECDITYADLHRDVQRLANGLNLDPPTNVGVDRVMTGQMPSDLG